MNETIYDKHVQFYLDFVDKNLANENGLWYVLLSRFREILGDRLKGARVCDIACGEGYLSRFLGQFGPREVRGIDLSAALVDAARQRRNGANLSYRVDDAQHLRTFSDASVDVAVSQLAIMDIPDHRALFRSVRRVLRAGGIFVFSLLHPCFETPFQAPDESPFVVDENGTAIAYMVRRYAREGFWQSSGTGVRGHMGAYHRTLSTLINDLLAAGFLLEKLDEPVVQGGGLFSQVPQALLVVARAI
ncbi:MAG TPA: class I SAM-dependent methyltransferase [Anaerolineales bacterium]|nr:class I SAM-dependent methyltransferase [Anaerolineales bacterium]